MVNSHHTPENRERIINTQQSSGVPIDVRAKLNNQVFVALSLIKNGKAMRKPDMVRRGEAMKGEAEDQLKLLNLLPFIQEFDAENLQKAIEKFDAETQAMKAGQS